MENDLAVGKRVSFAKTTHNTRYINFAAVSELSEASVWRWMENFVLSLMPVCVNSYIDRYARVVNDEENSCRFEGQRKETWIHMWAAWLIAVREWMVEFYSY